MDVSRGTRRFTSLLSGPPAHSHGLAGGGELLEVGLGT